MLWQAGVGQLAMEKDQILALYTQDQRIDVKYPTMRRGAVGDIVRLLHTDEGGDAAVIYSRLDEARADDAIREQIAASSNFDLPALNRTLGIPNTFQAGGDAPRSDLNCISIACEAEVNAIASHFAKEPGEPTHILEICWSVRQLCRLIFFRENSRPHN